MYYDYDDRYFYYHHYYSYAIAKVKYTDIRNFTGGAFLSHRLALSERTTSHRSSWTRVIVSASRRRFLLPLKSGGRKVSRSSSGYDKLSLLIRGRARTRAHVTHRMLTRSPPRFTRLCGHAMLIPQLYDAPVTTLCCVLRRASLQDSCASWSIEFPFAYS